MEWVLLSEWDWQTCLNKKNDPSIIFSSKYCQFYGAGIAFKISVAYAGVLAVRLGKPDLATDVHEKGHKGRDSGQDLNPLIKIEMF